MDLSEGSDEDAGIEFQQDIDEDDLLGGSDEEGENGGISRRSGHLDRQVEMEDEYVLDLELGEDEDELELVPETAGRARIAPVKVRAGIIHDKKTELADSTSVGTSADQVNEVGSQMQCDSSNSNIVPESDNDFEEEEEKVQRTRFTTERESLRGNTNEKHNNNGMGNPIQTLGQRQGRNFQNSSGGPRQRGGSQMQLRHMPPRHFNQYQQGRPQFPMNRPGPPPPNNLLGRGSGERLFRDVGPGMMGRNPGDIPVFQFPGQIFTDFNKPVSQSNIQGNPFLQPKPLLGVPVPQIPNPNLLQVQSNPPLSASEHFNPQKPFNTPGGKPPRNENHLTVIVTGNNSMQAQTPGPGQPQRFNPRGDKRPPFRPQQKFQPNPFQSNQNRGHLNQQHIFNGPRPGFRPDNQQFRHPQNVQPPFQPMNYMNNQPILPMPPQIRNQGHFPEMQNNSYFPYGHMPMPGHDISQPEFRNPHHHGEGLFLQDPNSNNFPYPQGGQGFGFRPPMQPAWNMGQPIPPNPNVGQGPGNMFQQTMGDYNGQLFQQHQMQMIQERNMFVPGRAFENKPNELYLNPNPNVPSFNPPSLNNGMTNTLPKQQRNESENNSDRRYQSERTRTHDHDRGSHVNHKPENKVAEKRKQSFTTEEFIRVGSPQKKLHSRLGPPVRTQREDQIMEILIDTERQMGIDPDYMEKIEQQRLKREEVLRLKAERRKMALNSEPSKDNVSAANVERAPLQVAARESPALTSSNQGRGGPSNSESQTSHSIYVNPKTFKGDLSLLNTNLRKINMSARGGGIQPPPPQSQFTPSTSDGMNQKSTSDSSERPRKILRIVKNKNGDIIRKSKVIIMRKPNQDSQD